jgi:hypothetical protein
MARLVDMPQTKKPIMVQKRPMRMMGFLPNLSDALPHATAVALWDKEKTDPVMPAHLATSVLSTPKLAIISGKYGNTDVRAIGSANLATASLGVSLGYVPCLLTLWSSFCRPCRHV